MIGQVRAAATDSLGNPDRRISEIADMLRDAVRLKSTFRQPTSQQLHESLCGAMQQVLLGRSVVAAGAAAAPSAIELDKNGFLKLLDHYQIRGAVADKCGLFDRLDINENGMLSLEEISGQLFGIKRAPLMHDKVRQQMNSIRDKIKARSQNNELGCRELSNALRRMDANRSGGLTRDELTAGTTWCGLTLTKPDVDSLFATFDANGDGHVTIAEFMRGIRGSLPARRLALIDEAFSRLDKDGSGVVTLEDLLKCFDVSKHPLVLNKVRTAQDVLRQFTASWDHNTDGRITKEEFIDYYKDVSALIEKDDYFELMMRNAWHISGGTGVAQNTSCRRVLVTFVDGNQRVIEIVDDLGIRASDVAAMKANLAKQGVKDIYKVEVYSQV